jgi:transposase
VAPTRGASEQKKARRLGALSICVDEAGFSFLAPLGPTWAPLARTPRRRRLSKRREQSPIGGLTTTGHVCKLHYPHPIQGEQVVPFWRPLRHRLSSPLIVVWDRARIHQAQPVQEFLTAHPEIRIALLPPYAPDLKPEEYCHGHVKQQLRNYTPATVQELYDLVERGFTRVRRRPKLLLSFFHHAGLSLNQFM